MYYQFSTYSYIINSSVVSKKELNWKQLRRQFLRVGCSAEVDSVVQGGVAEDPHQGDHW